MKEILKVNNLIKKFPKAGGEIDDADAISVLSVGDFRFQKKCEDRIKKMQESGTTVLFVSHSIEQVKKICNKIVWLDHGKVRMYGNTREVCEEYEKI